MSDDIRKSINLLEKMLSELLIGDEDPPRDDDEGKDPMYHPMEGSVGGIVYSGPHANKILSGALKSGIFAGESPPGWTGTDKDRLAEIAHVKDVPTTWYYNHIIRSFMFLATVNSNGKQNHHVIAMIVPKHAMLQRYKSQLAELAKTILPEIAEENRKWNIKRAASIIRDAIDPNETYRNKHGIEYNGKDIRESFLHAMREWFEETVIAYKDQDPLPDAYGPEEELILDETYQHEYVRDVLGDLMDDYFRQGGQANSKQMQRYFEKILVIDL